VPAANGPNSWIWWHWVATHGDLIRTATRQHLDLTVVAVGIGLLISFPLALAARRWRRLESPILAATGILYTVPSVALFAFLVPFWGLSFRTAEVGLVSYTLLILIRNIVTGLDGVPEDVREAARGMGYRPSRLLLSVELPLAAPAIIAGIRIATVTTIGLVTVTAIIGQGGLGSLIRNGFTNNEFRTPIVVGLIGSVLLALVADVLLRVLERLVTPWNRARRS
jgi:osmoprotectant transport system permease protein